MDQTIALRLGLPVFAGMTALFAVSYFAPDLLNGGTFLFIGVLLLVLAVAVGGIHTVSSIGAGASALTVLHPVVVFPLLAVLCLVGNVGGVGLALWSHATGGSLETDGVWFARADDGRFRPMLDVNGVSVWFVVDTEAKHILLSQSDARKTGFDPSTMTFDVAIDGPDGPQSAAAITLKSIDLSESSMADVPALVSANNLTPSTLGRDFFDRTRGWGIKGNTLMVVPPGANGSVVPMMLLLALSGTGILVMLIKVFVRDHASGPLVDALYPLAGLLVAIGVGFHQEVGALGRGIYDYVLSISSGSEGIRIARADDRMFHVNLTIDGTIVDFMVEPSTPINVLRPDVPKQIGISPSSLVYNERFEVAAGGAEYAANLTLPKVQLGATTIENLQLKVFATDRLGHNILGKPFLEGFKYWRADDDALIVLP
jgi:clan AA aspartic protease (TIGR02281 family)